MQTVCKNGRRKATSHNEICVSLNEESFVGVDRVVGDIYLSSLSFVEWLNLNNQQ